MTITELPESADDQRSAMVRNAQAESDEYTILNLDVVWTAEFAANRWVVELPQTEFELDKFLEPAVTPRSTATSCTRCRCTPTAACCTTARTCSTRRG